MSEKLKDFPIHPRIRKWVYHGEEIEFKENFDKFKVELEKYESVVLLDQIGAVLDVLGERVWARDRNHSGLAELCGDLSERCDSVKALIEEILEGVER